MKRFFLSLLTVLVLCGSVIVVSEVKSVSAVVCGEYSRAAFGNSPTQAARKLSIKLASNIDFYTGKSLGIVSPDIDHTLSLKQSWSVTCRIKFANDQINLRPTTASLNRSKGSLGPGDWSPATKKHACAYHQVVRDVVRKYGLYDVLSRNDLIVLKVVC
jgi:hypothetical protein